MWRCVIFIPIQYFKNFDNFYLLGYLFTLVCTAMINIGFQHFTQQPQGIGS